MTRVVEVAGPDYLDLVTRLCQRMRRDHDTGVWEAADFHWAWRVDQHPDPRRQLVEGPRLQLRAFGPIAAPSDRRVV